MATPEVKTVTREHKMDDPGPRLITVEPVLFLLFFVQGGLITLRTQYIEMRLARENNYTLPGENASTCNNASDKDPIQVGIETETARWAMYMEGACTLLPIVSALVLGTLSDFVGRRPMFVVGAVGHVIASVLAFLVAYFELPLVVLIGGEAVLGACGDTVLLTAVAFSYVADTTAESRRSQRSFRFVLNDLMTHLGLGAAFLSINIILQQTGGNYPLAYAVVAAPALLAFLYVAPPCLLRETARSRPVSGRRVVKELLLSIFRLLGDNANGRRWRLLLLLLCQFLYDVVYESLFDVITIYGLGTPFCWTHTMVGMYGVIMAATPAIGSVVGLKLLGPYLSEYRIVCIGFLSGIGLVLSTAIATTNAFLVYAAPVLGLLRVLPTSVLKSLMSKTVSTEEQGALFGCVAVVVSVAHSISPFLLNEVYSAMVRAHLPAATFVIVIVMLAVAAVIVSFLQGMSVWQPRPGYQSIQGRNAAHPKV